MKNKTFFIISLIPLMVGCQNNRPITPDEPLNHLNKVEVDFSFLQDTKDFLVEAHYLKTNIEYKSQKLDFNHEVTFKSFLKDGEYYVTQRGPGGPWSTFGDFIYFKYTFTTSSDLDFYLFTTLKDRNQIEKNKTKQTFYEDNKYFEKEGHYFWVRGSAFKLKEPYKAYENSDAFAIYYEFKNDESFNKFIEFAKTISFIN